MDFFSEVEINDHEKILKFKNIHSMRKVETALEYI